MSLSPEQEKDIDCLLQEYANNPREGLIAAYKKGLLEGSLRAISMVAAEMQKTQNSSEDTNDSEDNTLLSAADSEALIRLGIDPNKTFRQRNTVFSIRGYKPSRWKYPISVVTQTGARYKMPIDHVIKLQKAS